MEMLQPQKGEEPGCGHMEVATTPGSAPSPQSDAVTNELQELSLHPAPNLPPLKERKNVLQLKLQQRRTREELVSQGIMPPLKSPAAFHEQRRSLERARTEDYLKRKIRSRPERSELVRMHILEETSAEPSLQAKQLQLKRARLADDLNDKISHRPGPIELVHKNILSVACPVHNELLESPKGAGGESSSLDEDSSDALSPDQLTNHDSPLSGLPHMSPPSEGPGPGGDMSPTQFLSQPPPPPPPPLPLNGSESPLSKVSSGSVTSPASRPAPGQTKTQTRSSSERPPQRSKKAKDNKPKVKKLKYHQYIPPDQKADKERPPQMDSSYAKLLHQQQLFLQLQILSQQQQHYNYHTILPAPPKPQNDQPATPGSGPSPSRTIATTTTTPSTNQSAAVRPSQTPAGGAKPAALPPNLDEFKVAELKAELKLRGLTVSGTKNDLIERLRNYQEQSGSAAAKSSCVPSGLDPVALGEAGVTLTLLHKASEAQPQQIVRFSSTSSSPPVSPSPSERSLAAMSPDEASCGADIFEMVSSPLTQLSLHPSPQAPSAPPLGAVKEEGPSSCAAAAPEPAISMETSSLDKDQMLQEKDKQIEELTRMLRQKQQLVETLRSQLEQGKTVKEEDNQPPCVQARPPTLIKASAIQPPTLPNGLLSANQPPTLPNGLLSANQPPTLPNGLVLRLKKEEPEEKMEEAQVKKASPPTQCSQETLLRLQQIHRLQVQQAEQKVEQKVQQVEQKQQVSKPPVVKAPDTAVQKKDVQLLLRQQQIQQLIIQQTQQRNQLKVPSANQRAATLTSANQRAATLTSANQRAATLTSANQRAAMLTSANQRASLTSANQRVVTLTSANQRAANLTSANQRAALTSANQRAAALTSANQRAALSQQKKLKLQQKQTAPLSTQQVASLVINPQSGAQIHTQAISLDLLKTNGAPTLVTDSNGNHYLIALTSHHGDGTNGLSSLAKSNSRITLQRLQSSPSKLLSSDSESKEQPPAQTVTSPKKVQKAGLHLEVNGAPQLSQSVSAPPTLQPFFEDVSDGESIMSSLKREEECLPYDRHTLFTPRSPKPDRSLCAPRSKENGVNAQQMDDLFDLLLKSGEIPGFRSNPDPTLAPLHSDPPSPTSPPSPLQPGGAGRLEDFLESTTGGPLLGGEPDAALTLIDDLHSQMLSTPSILDPPSPMDTSELRFSPPSGLDFDSMDWLDISMGGGGGSGAEREGGGAPLVSPQTPQSVFSTDFLDTSDLTLHWESCL